MNKSGGVNLVFYDNYVKLCIKNGETPSGAAVASGVDKSAPSRWSAGADPRYPTMVKIANHFGITVSELLGVTPQTAQNIANYYNISVDLLIDDGGAKEKTPPPPGAAGETERDRKIASLVDKLMSLSDLNYEKVAAYVDGLTSAEGR